MATWSEWFKKARDKNIPINLVVNQPEDLARLHSSGLPFYDSILIDGKNFDKNRNEVEAFAGKHEKIWIRVYNKENRSDRYYKLGLECYADVISFIKSLDVNLVDFNIQLFEYHANKFGGNIVSDSMGVKIEIIEGTQELVSRSDKPFFHGKINELGKLEFFEATVPSQIQEAAKKAIAYLRVSRNDFLHGYFEFVVSDKGRVYFLDYKVGF